MYSSLNTRAFSVYREPNADGKDSCREPSERFRASMTNSGTRRKDWSHHRETGKEETTRKREIQGERGRETYREREREGGEGERERDRGRERERHTEREREREGRERERHTEREGGRERERK